MRYTWQLAKLENPNTFILKHRGSFYFRSLLDLLVQTKPTIYKTTKLLSRSRLQSTKEVEIQRDNYIFSWIMMCPFIILKYK